MPWTRYEADNGKPYWSDGVTSTWTDPNPAEEGAWEKTISPDGKPYYWNTVTKAVRWDAPPGFGDSSQQNGLPQRPPAQTPQQQQQQPWVSGGPQRYDNYERKENANRHRGYIPPSELAISNEPQYATEEEAKAAFMKMLKKTGVEADWTWKQTMMACVADEQYRALKDPRARKFAFEEYVIEAREREQQAEEARKAKIVSDFTALLKRRGEIRHFTRWKTAKQLLHDEPAYKAFTDEQTKRQTYLDHIGDLKEKHIEEEVRDHDEALRAFNAKLVSYDLDAFVLWEDVKARLADDPDYTKNPMFKRLTDFDIIKAFIDHSRALEKADAEKAREEEQLTSRKERKAREGFNGLLRELENAGKFRAGTKWSELYPQMKDDERLTALLYNKSGSGPLDFYWDQATRLNEASARLRDRVLDALKQERQEFTFRTSLSAFKDMVRSLRHLKHMPSSQEIEDIYTFTSAEFEREREQRKHREERRAIEDLRSRIKKLDPPVTAESKWDDIRPRLEKYKEFAALESDDLRKRAFDKVVKRLEETESRRGGAGGERAPRDRSRHDDRPRRSRNGSTPEQDPYEADRRRAMEQRERSYRKGSGPEYADRYRDDDRGTRSGRDYEGRLRYDDGPQYDDRRARDLDREPGRARGGATKPNPELDYGDVPSSGGSEAGQRRRGSDSTIEGRDSKRRKIDAKSPLRPAAEEPVELQSGSEEGEIEEV